MEISPKLNNKDQVYPQNSWYNYYAGYSDGFIKRAIEKYGVNYKNPVIVDPWNGSGTTTLVANMMGLTCYGFDINPAMILIAKAKLFNAQKLDVINIREQITMNITTEISNEEYLEDPLNIWFSIGALSKIRNIEEVIQNVTGIKQHDRKLLKIKNLCSIESLTNEVCFYYLALFTTVKQFAKVFVGSNPTWIKSKNIDKVNIDSSELVDYYVNSIESMVRGCLEYVDAKKVHLFVGDSKSVPLKSEIADIIITSPPYCTRIDYAIYTKIELSLLGYNNLDIQNLRRDMIGTPTIKKGMDYSKLLPHMEFLNVSDTCIFTMEQISSHQSKAAKSYYYKTYIQYFIGMYESIKEMYRVLNKSGIAIIVVQDSWFKDVYVDVPGILIEFSTHCGFSIVDKTDYEVKNNMNYINTKSRVYKKTKRTVESVIIIKKG